MVKRTYTQKDSKVYLHEVLSKEMESGKTNRIAASRAKDIDPDVKLAIKLT
jgi:hypothetical protein